LNRNYPRNPSTQPIKGVFVFHQGNEFVDKAPELFKALYCEVLTVHENRFTVKTSRGNLQAIKKRWQDHCQDTSANRELQTWVSQIIIGGSV
jgi:hypothetical protein